MAIDPKSAVFGGQEGSGLAQFLGDQPSAFETTQQPIQMLYNIKLQQQKQKDEEEKRRAKAFEKIGSYDAIFPQSEKELQEGFLGLREIYSELAAEGIDPEASDEFATERSKWNTKLGQNKAVKEWYDRVRDGLTTGTDYDLELAQQEIDRVLSLPTIEERFAAISKADPLVKRAKLFEGLKPPAPKLEKVMQGGKYITTQKLDEADNERLAELYVLEHPDHVEYIARRDKITRAEATEKYKKEVADKQRIMFKSIEKEERIPTGTQIYKNFGGGAVGKKDFIALPYNDPAIGQGKNAIRIQGTDAERPREFIVNGKPTNVKPVRVYKNADGTLSMSGMIAKRVSDQFVKENELEQLLEFATEIQLGGKTFERGEDGKIVEIVETEQVVIPVTEDGEVEAWFRLGTGKSPFEVLGANQTAAPKATQTGGATKSAGKTNVGGFFTPK